MPRPEPNTFIALLRELGGRDFTNVLVEGGGGLLGSVLDADQIDEVHAFIAPKILGGAQAVAPILGEGRSLISEALTLSGVTVQQVGDDAYLRGRRPA